LLLVKDMLKMSPDNKVNLHYVRIFVSAHDAELL